MEDKLIKKEEQIIGQEPSVEIQLSKFRFKANGWKAVKIAGFALLLLFFIMMTYLLLKYDNTKVISKEGSDLTNEKIIEQNKE